MRTVSPTFAEFSSSWAFRRFVRVTILPYTGCGTRRSIATTTVFSILSLTTRPVRVFRAFRASVCSLVISAMVIHSGAQRALSSSRSRRMVLSRAMSLRIPRSRRGSSSGSVALRKLRRKRSSSSSEIRAFMSSTDSSRMSLARIGMRLLAHDELGLHRHLRRRERHRLLRDVEAHAFELEHHAARLHDGHPHLGRALSLTHAGLGRLLRDRLVGEDADPHLAAALDVTGQRHAGRLDLPAGHPARLERLQAEGAERHRVATLTQPLRAALELLAELDALRTQHRSSPLLPAGVRGATTFLQDVALEDPHLHADGAVRGLRRRDRVVDVGAEGVERHTPLVIPLDARDLGAAQSPACLHLDPRRAHAHGALHRALHRAAERDALRQLRGDVVRHQLRVELGTLDLLDVDPDLLVGQVRELVAELVHFGALLPDDDTRTTGVQRHDDLPRLALDHDVRDRRVPEARLEILPQQLVLAQQRRQLTPRVVPRVPLLADAESEADRIGFLSHYRPPLSATTISTWLVRF